MKPIRPYGSWPSSISAAHVAAAGRGFADLAVDRAPRGDARLYWLESRPEEGGRSTVMRLADSGPESCLDAPISAQSTVHEYGGGAFAVHAGCIWFVNAADQAIWQRDPDGHLAPITDTDANVRYADLQYDARFDRLIAVAEDLDPAASEPVARVVCIDRDGAIQTVHEGHDFYASPRLSPAADRLVWLAWNHPNMPWDVNELWQARIDGKGQIGAPEPLWQPAQASLFGPVFDPTGVLHVVCDADNWWNIYCERGTNRPGFAALTAEYGEFAVPQWVFGQSTCAFTDDGRLFALMTAEGVWHLGEVDRDSGAYRPLADDWSFYERIVSIGDDIAFIAANADHAKHIRRITPGGAERVVRSTDGLPSDAARSRPEPLNWPTGDDGLAHGLFYSPVSAQWAAPAEQRPPLIVKCHGGPTGATTSALDARIQYWTSRGYAVLDVNYRGSTGYGRSYRMALTGAWGVADVEDCRSGAQHLAAADRIDPARVVVSGSSAGGYTVLSVLAFTDLAAAGASYYGIGDLRRLLASTHKFESRYLERLIGRDEQTLIERSPLYHAERLSCPVLFLQGGQDKVVPPDQAESMVAALRDRGVAVAYVRFESERHGFRSADNVIAAIEAERAFYSRVLCIPDVDDLKPLMIENFDDQADFQPSGL